jgi:RNA recognition motif-containing protein
MNLYVGNIAPAVQPAELQQIFAGLGQVLYARLAGHDGAASNTGFAFVSVPNDDNARNAVAKLNGKEFKGEILTVSPMPERLGVVGGAKK